MAKGSALLQRWTMTNKRLSIYRCAFSPYMRTNSFFHKKAWPVIIPLIALFCCACKQKRDLPADDSGQISFVGKHPVHFLPCLKKL